MASPRVFISSTCYDLAEERDGLANFCASFGFDTSLSERGDVFYHPDLHTHQSCVRETGNCQLFILIIGGRFGGKYKVDPSKSITNAEYAAAAECGTPTFAFVKQEVLSDHNVWQRNKEQVFAKAIQYPSIEKQEHAEDIFRFIDAVRLAPVNNGIFGFRIARDIHETLRKQWAGMMFDYLQNRSVSKQLSLTNDALGSLSVVSAKIEEFVKGIYRQVDEARADSVIKTIEAESIADEFLQLASKLVNDEKFLSELKLLGGKYTLPNTWWEFMVRYGYNKLGTQHNEAGADVPTLQNMFDAPLLTLEGPMSKQEEIRLQNFARGYEALKALQPEVKKRLISKFLWTKIDSDEAERRKAQLLLRTRTTVPPPEF